MPENGDQTERHKSRSRRRVLQLLGGAGAFSLAGCSGNGDGGDGGSDGGDGGSDGGDGGSDGGDGGSDGGDGGDGTPVNTSREVRKDVFVARLKDAIPTDVQFNEFRPGGYTFQVGEIVYEPLVEHTHKTNEFIPNIAREWDIPDQVTEGSTAQIHLREDPPHLWHDGDPVTAQDVVARNMCDKATSAQIWDFISDVEAVDEYTVEYTAAKDVNRVVFKANVLPQLMSVKHSLFEEHVTAIQEAESQSEQDEALAALLERSIGLDEMIGNGPFVPSDADSQRMYAEKFEDYNAAAHNDNVESINNVDFPIPNWSSLEWLYSTEDQALPNLRSENWDGSRANPDIGGEQIPNPPYEYRPDLVDLGESLGFNFNDEHFGKRNVRKAIAHVVNRKEVTEVMNAPSQPEDYISQQVPDSLTGMDDNAAQEWLGDMYSDFPTYNNGQNTDQHLQRATELLEQEGYSKQNGEWVTPGGEVWRPEFRCPTYWEKSTDPAVNILRRFGIQAQLTVEESSSHFAQTIPERNFDGIGHIWIPQGSFGYHPWAYYATQLRDAATNLPSYPIVIPEEVEIPETVGDPESDMTTVNVLDLVGELSLPVDDQRATEITHQLAWTYNQLIPQIQLRRHAEPPAVNVRDFHWPERDTALDRFMNWNAVVMDQGGLRARYQGE